MNEYEKKEYADGKDILYRVKLPTGRMSGWRSFRKLMKHGDHPWPWEMGHTYVEWRIKDSVYDTFKYK